MRVEDGFKQAVASEEHPYCNDPVLPSLMKRLLSHVYSEFEHDIVNHGNELKDDVRSIGSYIHAPVLTQYDHWGRRVDKLQTSEGWRKLVELTINNGYVSIPYVRKYGDLSRTYGFAKIFTGIGDIHVITCPLSMTDGAARVIELHGSDKMKEEMLPRLTSVRISEAYLSGQWMTERPGGSDVSMIETTATALPATSRLPSDLGLPYALSGFKWFSSAAEGNIAIALARTGCPNAGSRGLSAFLVPLRVLPVYPTPLSNGIRMHRLKNKIGTHGLPTAELELEGTRAWLIGDEGEGVKIISAMLNITRIHSAVHSVGSLRHALSIARSYARVRSIAGGKQLLMDNALHMATLARVTLLYRALAHLTFENVRLLGKVECGTASEEEKARLRLLTPVLKAYAAMRAVGGMQECMAALGGQGYMEETGIGRLMRDAVVEQIWEGTVNVLALDMMRACKDGQSLPAFVEWVRSIVKSAHGMDQAALVKLLNVVDLIDEAMSVKNTSNPLAYRAILILVAITASATCLLEHSVWSSQNQDPEAAVDLDVFVRWLLEGELQAAEQEVTANLAAREVDNRIRANFDMVYGISVPEQKASAKL